MGRLVVLMQLLDLLVVKHLELVLSVVSLCNLVHGRKRHLWYKVFNTIRVDLLIVLLRVGLLLRVLRNLNLMLFHICAL